MTDKEVFIYVTVEGDIRIATDLDVDCLPRLDLSTSAATMLYKQ